MCTISRPDHQESAYILSGTWTKHIQAIKASKLPHDGQSTTSGPETATVTAKGFQKTHTGVQPAKHYH